MNEQYKLEKHYNRDRLLIALFKMEQYYALSKRTDLNDKLTTCASKLSDHYRRLALNIIAKPFADDIQIPPILKAANIELEFAEYG